MLAVDGLYSLDLAQAVAMGRGALEVARAVGDRALVAAAASALCLGEAAAGEIAAAREHRAAALAEIDRLSDAQLAPHLEALFYLGWAENYLEHWDAALAHVDRGSSCSWCCSGCRWTTTCSSSPASVSSTTAA
jgi:hypothetical protein